MNRRSFMRGMAGVVAVIPFIGVAAAIPFIGVAAASPMLAVSQISVPWLTELTYWRAHAELPNALGMVTIRKNGVDMCSINVTTMMSPEGQYTISTPVMECQEGDVFTLVTHGVESMRGARWGITRIRT